MKYDRPMLPVVLAACLFAQASSPLTTQAAQTPNIVLIMADDLGYGDVGCYGSTINKTPHVDALAAGGIRFTDFHSAGPMCSPTRAATLTGQYQQRFGPIFDTALSGIHHRDRGLPHEAVTIAELLQQRGYRTACFGKWHLGYQPPWLPTSQGFELFRGLGSGDGDFHSHVDRSGNEDWWRNDRLEMDEGYTTDLLTQYAVEFIEAHREQPFFLYVPHLAIHFPWQGPNDPAHREKGKSYHDDKWGIIPNRANVAPHVKAMIESLDQSVGAIVAKLRQCGLAENTLVIFTSDNGGYLTYGPDFKNISSNGPLRGQKTELYEGGHRVPTIVSWPGKIQPSVTPATGHSVDLLPTIAAIAGVDREQLATDGIDLGRLLFAGRKLPERMLFWRANTEAAVRDGPWKLYRDGSRTELYNLDNDLGEQHDLASEKTDVVRRLTAAWNQWQTDVNRSARQAVSRVESKSETDEALRRTIEFEGRQREYFVRLPANYRPDKTYWPLVAVHGGGGSGRVHFLSTGIRQAADKMGLDAIVVSPSFSNTDMSASRFPALGEGNFLISVVEDLNRNYNLQPKILLTGYSRGGQFCHRFAFHNPNLVAAVAPFAAGTWTTPAGALLIDSFGKVDNPGTFLSQPENRSAVKERLHDLFSARVAEVAGSRPLPGATAIPFLVMCGSLDSRFDIAQEFANSLAAAGYDVEAEWPRTPHGSREKAEYRAEFKKYSERAGEFFQRVTQRPPGSRPG